MMSCLERSGRGKQALASRPQPDHRVRADVQWDIGHFASSSHRARQGKRRDRHGNERSAYAACLLCRLAQGVGGAAHGKGRLRGGMRYVCHLPHADLTGRQDRRGFFQHGGDCPCAEGFPRCSCQSRNCPNPPCGSRRGRLRQR